MIIATADNHLGYRQYGLKSREIDIQNSFKAIIDAAINTSSDITISGDLIHSNRPTSQTMGFLKKCHFDMIDNGVNAYVISGNHDKSNPHWISHFDSQTFGFKDIDNQTILTGGEGFENRLRIRGVPFCNKEQWEEIVDDINCNEPLDILLMHQSFSDFTNFENPDGFSAESLDRLDPKKCPLIVVGDTHVTDNFVTGSGILVISPGSTEMISANEDPEKFVSLINKVDGEFSIDQIPVPTRPYYDYHIHNQECLDATVEGLSAVVKENPVVLIKCNYELSDGMVRIKKLFGDEAVLRFRQYNPEVEEKILNESDVDILEILSQFVSTKDAEYSLAVRLADANCDARYEIDTYVERRLNELSEASVE